MIRFTLICLIYLPFYSYANICFEGIDCLEYDILAKTPDLISESSPLQSNDTVLFDNDSDVNLSVVVKGGNELASDNLNPLKNLTDIIVISLYNKSINNILLAILPQWNINIDKKLLKIRMDVVMQTTRKQAVIDIVNSLSANVYFYHNTKPLPTLSIIKI